MRGTWRSEMFTSGIALRRHQGLTVTSQPFSVSWAPFCCEDVVDTVHCCLKSLSAWNAALTTGLGFSSLTPDTISTDLEQSICNWCWEFHINAPEVTTRAGLWWDRSWPSSACCSSSRRRQKPHCSLHPCPCSDPPASKPSLLHGNQPPSPLLHCTLKICICSAQHSTNAAAPFRGSPKAPCCPLSPCFLTRRLQGNTFSKFSLLKDAI